MGLAIAGAAALFSFSVDAQPGLVLQRYDHAVFHNGHRVLFHGIWRRAAWGAARRARFSAKSAPSSDHDFTVISDLEDGSASRMAGDLVMAFRAAGLKSRPLAGKGAPSALARYVQGDAADLAIVPLDALLTDESAAQWRDRAPYVIRLGDEPIEIIARREISTVAQLNDRQVSLGSAEGDAGASAEALFRRLDVKPKYVRENLTASLWQLAQGKLDAVVVVGAADSRAVADFGKDGRFHLVSVPWSPALNGIYAPAQFTAKERPNLIAANDSIDTVATPMALIAIDAAPSSVRATQDAAAVGALFEKFDALLAPSTQANWREVNLAASADWPRLSAASDWIKGHRGEADAGLDSFRETANSVAAAKDGPGPADADKLYQSLMQWRSAGP